MGKFQPRVHRKDASSDEDHAHSVPGGGKTGGSLYKPNKDRTFPHTHLFQWEGETYETGPAPMGPGHKHATKLGETGPAVKMTKALGTEIPREKNDSNERNDFVERVGSKWVVKSESGEVLGTHPSKEKAEAQLRAVEANK